MDIVFERHVLINGMLFVLSPFALGRASIHEQLESIPLLGTIYAVIRRPRLERAPPRTKRGARTTEQTSAG
jgi:hypothetical protein